MDSAATRAERYRAKAEEVRAIAEAVKDVTTKELLLGVAADYLHMADLVERIDARNAPKHA